jgi:hypothetical protein
MKPLFSLARGLLGILFTAPRSHILVAILFAATILTPAAASPYLSELRLDWRLGTMTAVVEMDLAASGIRLPSGRSEAEKDIARIAPDLVRDTVVSIVLDSYRTVDDSLDDGSVDPEALRDFIESGSAWIRS